jgi:DNA-directed RNA polymerase III subunit RPC5
MARKRQSQPTEDDVIMVDLPDQSSPEEVEDTDDDEDPIVAEYDVIVVPEYDDPIYLLQQPNRVQHSALQTIPGIPRELRTKTKTGFIELDIEIKQEREFDRSRAVKWGNALRSAKEGGAQFGMANGFGKGMKPGEVIVPTELMARGASGRPDSPASDAENVDDEADAMSEGSVELSGEPLQYQTLGGQIIPPREGQPTFMLGVFHEGTYFVSSRVKTADKGVRQGNCTCHISTGPYNYDLSSTI